jgi:hypothetical protein
MAMSSSATPINSGQGRLRRSRSIQASDESFDGLRIDGLRQVVIESGFRDATAVLLLPPARHRH